jgi:3-methylcrotonyl-CoA carboxylase alpha subunit
LRAKMCDAAVRLAKSVGYAGAGTVEFLVEGGTLHADAPWYFIEMNTRLQVEHPVTEEITGLDLVEWQFRVAAGEKLPKAQSEISMSGHAIEVRICAEDPSNGFMPSVGRILRFEANSARGLRLETGVNAGGEVSPFYDSMIAKLIGSAASREQAIALLLSVLDDVFIAGPQTNIAFLRSLLSNTAVQNAKLDTGLIARELDSLTSDKWHAMAIVKGAHDLIEERWSEHSWQNYDNSHDLPWNACDGFQLGPQRKTTFPFVVDGKPYSVDVRWADGGCLVTYPVGNTDIGPYPPPDKYPVKVHMEPNASYVVLGGRQTIVSRPVYDIHAHGDGASTDAIVVPINGRLARIFVTAGQAVAKGDKIAVVEAMKMEHMLVAARDGTIDKIAATEGAQVTQGTLIATLVEEAKAA